jgi:hypothetical protein
MYKSAPYTTYLLFTLVQQTRSLKIMGQVIDCSCLEGALGDSGGMDSATKERVGILQNGALFMRSALLGLTSKELHVRLSDDMSKIEWKSTSKSTWSALSTGSGEEFGEIDLTTQVKTVKMVSK